MKFTPIEYILLSSIAANMPRNLSVCVIQENWFLATSNKNATLQLGFQRDTTSLKYITIYSKFKVNLISTPSAVQYLSLEHILKPFLYPSEQGKLAWLKGVNQLVWPMLPHFQVVETNTTPTASLPPSFIIFGFAHPSQFPHKVQLQGSGRTACIIGSASTCSPILAISA